MNTSSFTDDQVSTKTGQLQVRVNRSRLLGLLAEFHCTAGKVDQGGTTLTEALELMTTTGECMYEAELYRLQGDLILRQSPDRVAQAEMSYCQSLDVARSQQAKSLELRIAMNRSRLWQSEGKQQEACDLLAPIYEWFTEGFDTADLQEAKALLTDLGT